MAVHFSLDNPHLLDAATADRRPSKTNHSCPLLISRRILPVEYYTLYQTAVVLGGTGVAFRTGRHLSAGQAVVLQAFEFKEWFVQYNIWNHTCTIFRFKKICRTSRKWWSGFEITPRRWKQLQSRGNNFTGSIVIWPNGGTLVRVALETFVSDSWKKPDRLKYGRGRGIWHNPIMPIAFERDGDGDRKEVNIRKKLQIEDSAIERLVSPLELMYVPGQWQGGYQWRRRRCGKLRIEDGSDSSSSIQPTTWDLVQNNLLLL